MNKKALLAVALVIVIPVASYLLVKHYSEEAVQMPHRFYSDSINTYVKDGKEYTDTIWHKVNNITLTNQLGQQVSLDDIKGKIIVADFFFTHCPNICPTLTQNMRKLQNGLKIRDNIKNIDTAFIQFLSFTVDPERDSVSVLKKYADHYGVDHDIWWMLTGPKKKIYDFALEEMKMGMGDEQNVDTNFIHSSRFVLLDKDRIVRGYYDGTDSVAINNLARDLVFIMLEKDKKKKRNLFGSL
ncbi:MAG: SCO family protein [Williamsia sp.]|nr:SCO family protein [Williamsia sp.]